jgi:hypothetical protein
MTIGVPPPSKWYICQIVVDCISPIVTTCVQNQSRGHWLLSDVLHSAISMSLKLIEDLKNIPSSLALMEEDSSVAHELICLASNIKKEVCGVLNGFFSFLKKIYERKTHNMFALMLDSRFKSLCLVSSFIGHDQGITIAKQYNAIHHYILCS